MFEGFVNATLISFAIMSIWYRTEYEQFGELQWNRKCDDIVCLLYFIALWIGFSK